MLFRKPQVPPLLTLHPLHKREDGENPVSELKTQERLFHVDGRPAGLSGKSGL